MLPSRPKLHSLFLSRVSKALIEENWPQILETLKQVGSIAKHRFCQFAELVFFNCLIPELNLHHIFEFAQEIDDSEVVASFVPFLTAWVDAHTAKDDPPDNFFVLTETFLLKLGLLVHQFPAAGYLFLWTARLVGQRFDLDLLRVAPNVPKDGSFVTEELREFLGVVIETTGTRGNLESTPCGGAGSSEKGSEDVRLQSMGGDQWEETEGIFDGPGDPYEGLSFDPYDLNCQSDDIPPILRAICNLKMHPDRRRQGMARHILPLMIDIPDDCYLKSHPQRDARTPGRYLRRRCLSLLWARIPTAPLPTHP
jgi:hypothetical protein